MQKEARTYVPGPPLAYYSDCSCCSDAREPCERCDLEGVTRPPTPRDTRKVAAKDEGDDESSPETECQHEGSWSVTRWQRKNGRKMGADREKRKKDGFGGTHKTTMAVGLPTKPILSLSIGPQTKSQLRKALRGDATMSTIVGWKGKVSGKRTRYQVALPSSDTNRMHQALTLQIFSADFKAHERQEPE